MYVVLFITFHSYLSYQYYYYTWTIYNTFIYKIGASMNIHLDVS